jgi:DNA-binding transcriptional LysR family regulator
MLNLHRLAVLLEVEQHGTLAAAARALSYSPSAVSQQLAQLEREVGVALTEPVGRGIRLTDAARVLITHARGAIAQLERAEAELAVMRGRLTGRLRVAAFQTGLLSLLPGALAQLEREYPQLRIDVAQREAADATSGLLAGVFDIVLGEEYPGFALAPNDRLDRVDLGGDDLFLAIPRTGPWSAARRLGELRDALWALDPAPTAPGRWVRALCRAKGFEPDVAFDGIDLLMQVHMVRTGQAVAALPGLLGSERMQGVRLVQFPAAPQRTLFTLARSAAAGHPATVAFRDALARAFAAHDRPTPESGA